MLPCCFPAALNPQSHGRVEPGSRLLAVVNDGRLVHLDASRSSGDSQGQLNRRHQEIVDQRARIGGPGRVAIGSGAYSFACRKKNERSKEVECAKSVVAEDYATAMAIDDDGKIEPFALENGGLVIADLTRKSISAKVDVGARCSRWPGVGTENGLAAGTVSGQSSLSEGKGSGSPSFPPSQSGYQRRLDRSSSRLATACDTNCDLHLATGGGCRPVLQADGAIARHTGTISPSNGRRPAKRSLRGDRRNHQALDACRGRQGVVRAAQPRRRSADRSRCVGGWTMAGRRR